MTKQEKANFIRKKLAKLYPNPTPPLNFTNPFTLYLESFAVPFAFFSDIPTTFFASCNSFNWLLNSPSLAYCAKSNYQAEPFTAHISAGHHLFTFENGFGFS